MIRLRRPSAREVEAVLGSSARPLSYPEVGLTAKLDAPDVCAAITARYDLDRHAFTLGRGRALFERARTALLGWCQFEIPWLYFHGSGPVASGQVVATSTRVAGLWFLNPCRVVYADPGDPDSLAYAYGTLNAARNGSACSSILRPTRFATRSSHSPAPPASSRSLVIPSRAVSRSAFSRLRRRPWPALLQRQNDRYRQS